MPFSKRDLTLIAASVGVVSALFFSFGSTSIGNKEICLLATPFWDFSEPVARALIAQKAQNIVGSVLLVISFLLQILAEKVPSNTASLLPQWLRSWFCLVLAIFLITIPLGLSITSLIEAGNTDKVLELSKFPKSKTPQPDHTCEP